MKRKVFGLFISLLVVFSIGASIIAYALEYPRSEDYTAISIDIEEEYEAVEEGYEAIVEEGYEAIYNTVKDTIEILTSELSELLGVEEGTAIHTPSNVTKVPASELLESLISRRERHNCVRNCVNFDEFLEMLLYTSLYGGYVYVFDF